VGGGRLGGNTGTLSVKGGSGKYLRFFFQPNKFWKHVMRLSDWKTERSEIYVSLRGTTRGGRVSAKESPGPAHSSLGRLNGGVVANEQGGACPVVLTLSMPNGLFVSVSVVRFGLSLLAMMVQQVMTVRDLLGWRGEDCLIVFSLVQNDPHPFSIEV